jgi:hypothetical protein
VLDRLPDKIGVGGGAEPGTQGSEMFVYPVLGNAEPVRGLLGEESARFALEDLDLPGCEGQVRLEPGDMRLAGIGECGPASRHRLDGGEEGIRGCVLGDEALGAMLPGGADHAGIVMGGDDQDGGRARQCLEVTQHLTAVPSGESQVEQDEVDGVCLEEWGDLEAVTQNAHDLMVAEEYRLEPGNGERMVFDDENAHCVPRVWRAYDSGDSQGTDAPVMINAGIQSLVKPQEVGDGGITSIS